MESKRLEVRTSSSQAAIIDRTIHAIAKWRTRRHSQRRSRIGDQERVHAPRIAERANETSKSANCSSLPTELHEQILASVGYDIPLLPNYVDRLKFPEHFREYFQLVDFEVRARNQTLRNCRLVCSAWNDIASKNLNTYLVFRKELWKDHGIWRNELFRRQVRHVWIMPPPVLYHRQRDPWHGLFAMIFTGFPNLETLYASFPACYDNFYSQQFLRLHVPRNLRILGLDGPVLRDSASPARGELQLGILRLFPKLETVIEVGSSSDDILIFNEFVRNVTCSCIKMSFCHTLKDTYFARIQSLSLAGGHLVQDETIVALASLCPPLRSLQICGFDRSFTMRGIAHSGLIDKQV